MHVHYRMTCLKLLLHPCPAREGSAPIGEQYWRCVRCLSLSLALSQQFIDPGCTDQETLCEGPVLNRNPNPTNTYCAS
jgi:hypothetical protein